MTCALCPFILSITFHISFGILATLFNAMELYVVYRKRSVKSSFCMTLLSLAIADFLTGVASTGFGIMSLLDFNGTNVHGHAFEGLMFIGTFSICASMFHICMITVERLFAVVYPIKCLLFQSAKKPRYVLAFIWILAAFLSLLHVFDWRNDLIYEKVQSAIVLLTGCILLILYTLIITSVKLHITRNASNRYCNSPGRASFVFRTETQKCVTLSAFSVTFSFIICTFPLAIFTLIPVHFDPSIAMVLLSLAVLRAVLDPLTYFFMKSFKRTRRECLISPRITLQQSAV